MAWINVERGFCPCKDCGRRRFGCHEDCGAYAVFNARREQLRQIRHEMSEAKNDCFRSNYRRATTAKKPKG